MISYSSYSLKTLLTSGIELGVLPSTSKRGKTKHHATNMDCLKVLSVLTIGVQAPYALCLLQFSFIMEERVFEVGDEVRSWYHVVDAVILLPEFGWKVLWPLQESQRTESYLPCGIT